MVRHPWCAMLAFVAATTEPVLIADDLWRDLKAVLHEGQTVHTLGQRKPNRLHKVGRASIAVSTERSGGRPEESPRMDVQRRLGRAETFRAPAGERPSRSYFERQTVIAGVCSSRTCTSGPSRG